jgi:hypothetical protein
LTWVGIFADIDDPIQVSSTSISKSGPKPNHPEQIAMLADMGFTSAQARKALRETVRDFFFFGGGGRVLHIGNTNFVH